MGGVYVFNEHDGGSFMQNPAYTCFVKGLNWSIFDVDVGVGDVNEYDFIKTNLLDTGTSPTFSELSQYYGKSVWVGLGGYTSLSMPCFGVAGTYGAIVNFEMYNPAFPSLHTFYQTDYGFSLGGGIPLGPSLAFGMDVKRISRSGGPYEFGPDTVTTLTDSAALTTLTESVKNAGTAYGLDAGLVARFSSAAMNPTVSLSWKDVGSSSFVKTNGTEAPNMQKDNLVLGMTVDGSVPLFGFSAGLEYRHITETGEQIGKKLHLGTELNIAMFDIRAGFYQGYTTYGLGIDLWIFQLDAALYSVEKGIYPGQSPEKRGKVGLLLDLEFDPDFKLVDAGGKRRRLKQRR